MTEQQYDLVKDAPSLLALWDLAGRDWDAMKIIIENEWPRLFIAVDSATKAQVLVQNPAIMQYQWLFLKWTHIYRKPPVPYLLEGQKKQEDFPNLKKEKWADPRTAEKAEPEAVDLW